MMPLITVPKAQRRLAELTKRARLDEGLTQQGLALRAGVSLATLRKFEQKGLISLESFLKLAMALDRLDQLVAAMEAPDHAPSSLDEVLEQVSASKHTRKRGWRT